MFLTGKPTKKSVDDFLRSQEDAPFSYGEVGASRAGSPVVPGYVVDHNRVKLGSGEEVFVNATRALWGWRMFDLGWVEVQPSGAPVEVCETVAVLGNHYGFSSLNPCRIVYLIEDEGELSRSGFAYGTLPEHAASGEERFIVEWNRKDDSVWYDLYAFSQPNQEQERRLRLVRSLRLLTAEPSSGESRETPCPELAKELRPRLVAGYGPGCPASVNSGYLRAALEINFFIEWLFTSAYTPG